MLDKGHEDDAVLPPDTEIGDSGLLQKADDGLQGPNAPASVEDGGISQPPVDASPLTNFLPGDQPNIQAPTRARTTKST